MTPANIEIAASDAAALTPKKSVTVSELNLLALSDIDIQTISDIFFRVDSWGGIVGGTFDPYYSSVYGQHELSVVVDGVDEDGNPVQYHVRARNADGDPLNAYLDENGDPILVGKDAEGNPQTVPIYILDENGDLVQVNGEGEDPSYWTDPISGNIYRDGLVGLAYYLGDQVLDEVIQAGVPLISDAASFMYNKVNPYFFEAGIEETFRAVASELTGGINGPVGQALAVAEDLSHNWLTYTGAILTLVASGVPVAGPDLAAATSIFFFGGAVETDGKEYNQGIDGVINYVVDRVLGAAAPAPEDPDEDGSDSEDAGKNATDSASAKSGTAVLASARKALPALGKLINLDLKVEDGATVDKAEGVAEGGTEVTPATEVSQPETPKFELPKLDLGLDLTPKTTTTVKEVADVKEAAAEEKSDETEGAASEGEKSSGAVAEAKSESSDAAATKTPNKFAPKSRTTERKKSAGEKFVENATKSLEKAFKPTTKAGAGKQETTKGDTAKGDTDGASGAASGAKAGNAHSDTKDNKGTKDNKDK
ncbi:hypothetical protein HGA11_15305 [Mycolicibacterium septicum DSM 44393]|uniref:Uncharacterized protein n=1 Tax=Mycolicibacterium septicum DSM 44393 TaxID=1341646 RepID=A0A7X6MQR8_9MYCO|nr:hypothetical protein [Mycolicibacterium septicum]NKZ12346.1 hypothetical protein [Mycolicibacterium septicum DSM 44393]